MLDDGIIPRCVLTRIKKEGRKATVVRIREAIGTFFVGTTSSNVSKVLGIHKVVRKDCTKTPVFIPFQV